ncbi:RNA methyltransferase [Candidatus Micrarchaeota archaeon]|nr:RNA methyltransferase [Candidatus Micrarchaeota archaeon]
MASKFRIVLVEPEYEINLGSVCRVMKNFGQKSLYLVNPKCDKAGFDATMFSKHAKDVLQKATVCNSVQDAIEGCELVIGTSGILSRHKHSLRNPLTLPVLAEKLKERKKTGEIALLFGREGIGLSQDETDACGLLVTIPTSRSYPVMNLSHSVAVVLYALCQIRLHTITSAGANEKKHLKLVFNSIVDRYASSLRNPHKIKIAFERVLGRSLVSDKECAALLSALSHAKKELEASRP